MNSSRQTNRAILLLLIQATLVLSIAGKYLYERKTCPRIWVRAAQFNTNQPFRGRYLALQFAVNACALPRDQAHHTPGYNPNLPGYWRWTVRPVVQDGKLVPVRGQRHRPPGADRRSNALGQPPLRARDAIPGRGLFYPRHSDNPHSLEATRRALG